MSSVKRSKFAIFLNTDTPNSPDWFVIGEGVVSAEIGYNPQTDETTYIHQNSGTTEVQSYRPSLPIEGRIKKGDPAYDYLEQARKQRRILDAAIAQVLHVSFYDQPTEAGLYPASLHQVNLQIDRFGGDGGAAVSLDYTIHYQGDATIGLYDPINAEFIPAGAPEPEPPPDPDPEPEPPTPVVDYLIDTFTDDNGVLLNDHEPDDGGPWTGSASMRIWGNKAQAFDASNNVLRANYFDPEEADHYAEVTVTTRNQASSTLSQGIRFRQSDATNYWALRVMTSSDALRLVRVVDNVETVVRRVPVLIGPVATHDIAVRTIGNNIWFALNGIWARLSGEAFNNDATEVGLYGHSRSAGHPLFDDCIISSPIIFDGPDADMLLHYRPDDTEYILGPNGAAGILDGQAIGMVGDRTNHGNALFTTAGAPSNPRRPLWVDDQYEGAAVSRGDGVDDSITAHLAAPVDPATGTTLAIIYRYNEATPEGSSHRDILRLMDGTNTNRLILWQYGSGTEAGKTVVRLQRVAGESAFFMADLDLPLYETGVWHTLIVSFASDGGGPGHVIVRLDGATIANQATTESWDALMTTLDLHAGGGGAYSSASDIAECRLYKTALDLTAIQALEAELAGA